jgi:hypothetical protein
MGMVIKEGEDLETFKSDCMKEFDWCVTNGEIDVLSEMQSLKVPLRNELMVGYELEMWFGLPNNDWCCGKVFVVKNEKIDRMRIEWNKECIHQDNPKVIVQYLTTHKYNADETSGGVWRQYFNE